jgi:hypothetical protein
MRKHVKILGMKFKIVKVPNDHKELQSENGGIYYAVIAHTKNKIYVGKDYSKNRIRKTLLHEIIHGIDAELKLGLTHKTVYRLASGLSASDIKIKAS